MAMRVEIHPEAMQEILAALAYNERVDSILAEDLDQRIDAAVEMIAMKPGT